MYCVLKFAKRNTILEFGFKDIRVPEFSRIQSSGRAAVHEERDATLWHG
jgi:hypothetical protein